MYSETGLELMNVSALTRGKTAEVELRGEGYNNENCSARILYRGNVNGSHLRKCL